MSFRGALGDKEIKEEEIKDLLGIIEVRLISNLCDYIIEKKSREAISFLNKIIEDGLDLQSFIKVLINYIRQGLILKIGGDELPATAIVGLTKEETQNLKKQMTLLEIKEICKILNFFMEAENKTKYSSIPQLPLELAIIEAVAVVRSDLATAKRETGE